VDGGDGVGDAVFGEAGRGVVGGYAAWRRRERVLRMCMMRGSSRKWQGEKAGEELTGKTE